MHPRQQDAANPLAILLLEKHPMRPNNKGGTVVNRAPVEWDHPQKNHQPPRTHAGRNPVDQGMVVQQDHQDPEI